MIWLMNILADVGTGKLMAIVIAVVFFLCVLLL